MLKNLPSLAEGLQKNKEINKVTFIHNQCWTKLRNSFRKRISRTKYVNSSYKRLPTRSESKPFECF